MSETDTGVCVACGRALANHTLRELRECVDVKEFRKRREFDRMRHEQERERLMNELGRE